MQGSATAKPPVADRRMLLTALVLAAIAAGLIVAFLATRSSGDSAGDPVPTRLVVVAAADIPAGKTLEASDVTVRSIPETAVVAGAYVDRAELIGMTARYPMARGEQFAPSRVVAPFRERAPSFHIPHGMRGFTVPVSITHTPISLIVAGDFVDIIFTATLKVIDPDLAPTPEPQVTPSANEEGPKDFAGAVTLIQNVQVLAIERRYPVDQEIDGDYRGELGDEKDFRYVTLIVTPEQAQLLWLAVDQGKLTLSLRRPGDNDEIDLPPVAEPVRLN